MGSKTAFRYGYNDQEVSTKLMTLANADAPTHRYVPLPPANFERNPLHRRVRSQLTGFFN
jgi:hypothetical protein